MKAHIKKNDEVEVRSGNSRGKKGKVLAVNLQSGRAIVEGVNRGVKHVRASQSNPGGRVERELSIHISNLVKC
jgi:large subunit ribosomal protein L24